MFTDLKLFSTNTFNDFDDVFKSFDELMNSSRLSFQDVFPPMNVFFSADDNSALLEIALAGYSKEELSIEVDGNKIIVEATPREEEPKEGKYFKRKIKKLAFKRAYELPNNTYDIAESTVDFKDGLLSINVPVKKEISTSKKLAIN